MTPPDVDDVKALDDLGATLTDLAEAVARLSDDVPAALDVDDSREAVVRLLADLREQRIKLAEIEAFVEAAAVKRIPYSKEQQRIAGQIVEIHGGKKGQRSAWQHDDIAWKILTPTCTDPTTGRIVPEVRQIAAKVWSDIAQVAHIDYWRVKPLRELFDIEPDEFCEQHETRRTVHLTPAVEAEPATDRVAS